MQGLSSGSTEVLSAVLTTDDLSEVVVDARLWYIDKETGTVYVRATQDGDDPAPEEWVEDGTIPGLPSAVPGDGVPPAAPTGLSVTPSTMSQPDGTRVPTLLATWDANTEVDITGYEVQFDPYPGGTFAAVSSRFTGGTSVSLESALGGVAYSVRVRAGDWEGFKSPWSDVVTVTTTDDGTAPEVPSDVLLLPGYKLIGVRWSPNVERDLDHYEVRHAPDLTGAPDIALADTINTASSSMVISGLGVLAKRWAQVRAVDRSGMVQTSIANPTPVDAAASPEAGWSPWAFTTTLAVGSSDLAVNALAAEFINTGLLNASRILAGSMSVGGAGMADGIVVYDIFGRFIARLDEKGLVMVDPDAPTSAMWLHSGSLRFSRAYNGNVDTTVWTTAVTPDGINAEAITFGSLNTGYNIIPNSSMELQAWSTAADVTKTWTLTTDWDDATGGINLKVSTGDLSMTAL